MNKSDSKTKITEKLFFDHEITLRYQPLLLLVIFWSYGLYGAGSHPSFGIFANSIITIYILILTIIITRTFQAKSWTFAIKFTKLELVGFIAIATILTTNNWTHLESDLVWDQLAHFRTANILTIKLLPKIANVTGDYPATYIAYLLNLLLLFFVLGSLYFSERPDGSPNIARILGAIAACRIIVIYFKGGNGEPYPPFRTFAFNLTSVLLGSNDFSGRSSSFLTLIVFLFILYLVLRSLVNKPHAALLILTISSCELIQNTAAMLEQSIFAFCILSLFLIRIASVKPGNNEELFWLAILTIGSLIRSSLIIPLLFFLIYLFFFTHKKATEKIQLLIIPAIVAPWFLQLYIFGSNAFYQPDSAKFIPFDHIPLMRIYFAIKAGVALDLWMQSNPTIFVAAYIATPLCLLFINREYAVLIILISIAMCYSFFSIRPDHWGWNRYQVEYLLPFAFLSIHIFATQIYRKIGKPLSNTFLAIVFILSFIPARFDLRIAEKYSIGVMAEQLYDVKNALKWAATSSNPNRIVLLSVTYGEAPFINAGFNAAEIGQLIQVRNRFLINGNEFGLPNYTQLANSTDVDLILIADCPWDRSLVINHLTSHNWTEVAHFKGNNSNNLTLAFRRASQSN